MLVAMDRVEEKKMLLIFCKQHNNMLDGVLRTIFVAIRIATG